jgi:hypothetical protein
LWQWVGQCVCCGAAGAPMTCSGCHSARFCNRECQKRGWSGVGGHQRQCAWLSHIAAPAAIGSPPPPLTATSSPTIPPHSVPQLSFVTHSATTAATPDLFPANPCLDVHTGLMAMLPAAYCKRYPWGASLTDVERAALVRC